VNRKTRGAKPKPAAKPRVAAHAPPIHQPNELLNFGSSLTAAAAADPTDFTNATYIAPLKSALTTLAAAIPAAKGGNDLQQAAVVNGAQKVHNLIMRHAAWVQGAADDMVPEDAVLFITKAGFTQAKVGHRATVTSPVVENASVSGTVEFELPSVEGGVLNFTEISIDAGKTWARSVDTEHVKDQITGLTPGLLTYFRFRTFVRGKGYTSWFQTSLLVT
jgi:hypothetical protein